MMHLFAINPVEAWNEISWADAVPFYDLFVRIVLD